MLTKIQTNIDQGEDFFTITKPTNKASKKKIQRQCACRGQPGGNKQNQMNQKPEQKRQDNVKIGAEVKAIRELNTRKQNRTQQGTERHTFKVQQEIKQTVMEKDTRNTRIPDKTQENNEESPENTKTR